MNHNVSSTIEVNSGNTINGRKFTEFSAEDLGIYAEKTQEHLAQLKQARFKKTGKGNAPSSQLEFATHIFGNKFFAASQNTKVPQLYQWTGNYWNYLDAFAGRKIAFNWLENYHPEQAGDKMAGECLKTALLKAKALPARTHQEVIIPFKSNWVHVSSTGEMTIQKPNREMGITYQINADIKGAHGTQYMPKPLPKDSMFHKFISTSLPDENVRNLVQEYLASTFIPDVRFQQAACWVGSGGNGKSVLLSIIEYCHEKVASIRLDAMKNFGLVNLVDASLATCAEAPRKGIDEEALKKCITGDSISIESKGVDEFNYRPFAKWIICCNTFPKFMDNSDGVFRRLQVINWNRTFRPHEMIPQLDKKIIDSELHLFMDWCLEGLQRLMKRGEFDIPQSVRNARDYEKLVNDTVLQYADACFIQVAGDGSKTNKNDLYKGYLKYAETNYLTPVGVAEFWKRMNHIFEKKIVESKVTDMVTRTKVRMVNLKAVPPSVVQTEEEVAQEQMEIERLFGYDDVMKVLKEGKEDGRMREADTNLMPSHP